MDAADAARRAAELRAQVARHAHLYYVLDQPEISDAEYDALYRELQALEEEYPRAAHPRLADAARRRPAAGEVRAGPPPRADALAGQRARRGRAARLGRAQPAPARRPGARRRAVPLRRRAQDRRPRHLAHLPRRRVRGRRDARQRHRRRGRDRQPADHPRGALPPARRPAAPRRRGARRGLPAAGRLRAPQRGARRRRPAGLRQPAQRRRRVDPPARPGRRRRRARCRCSATASAPARVST